MLAPHARYQFKPFFGSSHIWAIEQLRSLGAIEKALDVGSGSGALGNLLKDLGAGQVFAVEPDADTRAQTLHSYDRIEGTLSAYASQQFDVILLLDVLEHTPDPFEYFQQTLALLKPGGHALISVPNIAHWSVRIPLLFGVFNYTERGLLDKTHLQFFTRSRFKQLLTSSNWVEIRLLNATIEPLEFLLPQMLWDNFVFRALAKLRLALANFLPGLFAYQHLALLQKKK